VSWQYVQDIRKYEIEQVLPLVPGGSAILEIGAGAGWQARTLTERGFSVVAIDVQDGAYAPDRVWPVIEYDGTHIPFPDHHFDIVFSSNVLEHIPHVKEFQVEIKRVLKPGGRAIHVLPTPSWRFWTNITHYLYLVKAFFYFLRPESRPEEVTATVNKASELGKLSAIRKALFPVRHGEAGNAISEIGYFSRFYWSRLFRNTGWIVETCYPTRLFYTGFLILGSRLSIEVRHIGSYILGSSCHVFALRNRRW
jgi:ubiquinone/menaquinone biosynthesis C-methylase UbiE